MQWPGHLSQITTTQCIKIYTTSLITIESAGLVHLLKNSLTEGFAKDNTGNEIAIKDTNNQHVSDSTYAGWQMLGAENINGVNQVVWRKSNNTLRKWSLDTNWKQISTEIVTRSKLFQTESNFNLDLNGDNKIGANYITTHTAGNVAFQKDSATGLYAVSINNGSPQAITWNGKQIYEGIYSGWQTLAAATINGTNTVLWKNIAGNYLHTWSLDSNWSRVSPNGYLPRTSRWSMCLMLPMSLRNSHSSWLYWKRALSWHRVRRPDYWACPAR